MAPHIRSHRPPRNAGFSDAKAQFLPNAHNTGKFLGFSTKYVGYMLTIKDEWKVVHDLDLSHGASADNLKRGR